MSAECLLRNFKNNFCAQRGCGLRRLADSSWEAIILKQVWRSVCFARSIDAATPPTHVTYSEQTNSPTVHDPVAFTQLQYGLCRVPPSPPPPVFGASIQMRHLCFERWVQVERLSGEKKMQTGVQSNFVKGINITWTVILPKRFVLYIYR